VITASGTDSAWIVPEWPSAPGRVRALSTLRCGGGVSKEPYASLNLGLHVGDDPRAVQANRAWLRAAADLPAEPLWLEQVHGTHVVEHHGPIAAAPPRADAVVIFEPGRVGAVMTADCLPVVFADRGGTCVGIAHAGWRGLVGGVLESTIAALETSPSNLTAWLGPAISQTAFEVGPEVREAFVARQVAHAAAFERNARGRFHADLYLLAHQALALAGVTAVSGGGRCTVRERDHFYSHRRDGAHTGRMATLVWLDDANRHPLSAIRSVVKSRSQ
jgi:YfiH family protein